ncbi:hypothetical protein VNO78_11272 [Psophocarpus tetragonolobus]|uniref:Uncharacterized protein n=1 Tax=Psophocarpus tetragonolobus TaxID=3891 RepID=A0AAN9XNS4_PSOTE
MILTTNICVSDPPFQYIKRKYPANAIHIRAVLLKSNMLIECNLFDQSKYEIDRKEDGRKWIRAEPHLIYQAEVQEVGRLEVGLWEQEMQKWGGQGPKKGDEAESRAKDGHRPTGKEENNLGFIASIMEWDWHRRQQTTQAALILELGT